AEDGIRDFHVTGVQTCALPICEALVRAAVRHLGARTPRVSPDTGSLREDVLATLRHSNETRLGMWVVLSVQLAGFYAETGITPRSEERRVGKESMGWGEASEQR